MKLRSLLLAVPVLTFFKLTACADQDNNNNTDPTVDGGGGEGGNVEGGEGGVDPGSRGACNVTKEGTAGMLINGRLLLPDQAIDGEILVDGTGTIQCVGKSCSATPSTADDATYQAAYKAATQITCKDAVISPGLINPHDHITFANTPPLPHGTERFEHRHDWRKGIRGHKKLSTWGTGGRNAISMAELRFVMSGTTTAASAGGADGLLRNVDGSAAQLEGLPVALVNSDTFPLGDSNQPTPFPPADCSGYSASRRKASAVATEEGYLPHISEGVDQAAALEHVCTADDVNDAEHFLLAKQTAVIHAISEDPSYIAKYHAKQTALIWSPRSNVDLYGNTAPVVEFDNLGVMIALGTDWLPSGSMNMARELRCADELNKKYYNNHFSERAIWQMVTFNAAYAIGAGTTLGSLRPGYVGDIAIFSAKASKDYRAVIDAGVEDTIMVARAGKILYGDANLLASKGLKTDTCEDLDVCGVKKKACVKQDLGTISLADLLATKVKNPTNGQKEEPLYPLFFCKDKVPDNEPSCVPSRGATASAPNASQYSGAAAADDKDGDGVPDSKDNCPNVFNPIRPVDGDKQADSDGDGIGDACDKCPVTAGEACTKPNSQDMDDDGILDVVDNCPEIANPDQADDDKDGKGNACDVCPTEPNPGATKCVVSFTAKQLRDPSDPAHPKAKTRVRVKDVYVTGVRSAGSNRGFFVQAGTDAFSGFYVDTGNTSPTVSVGNKVDVDGDYEETFFITTLKNGVAKVTDAGTTLPFGPLVFSIADITNVGAIPGGTEGASAEPYEGMLCQIDAASVSIANPDAPGDFDEFSITDASGGEIRVDDFLFDALDNNYAVGTAFSKVVGICYFSFNNRKILPRNSTTDLAP